MNFWVLGFLFHFGFSSFFVFFSMIGIEYVYVPKTLIIECSVNQELHSASLEQVDSQLLSVSLIQQSKRKLRGFVAQSTFILISLIQDKFLFTYQMDRFDRILLGMVQRGPPTV